jgi:hypothetical protein
MKSCCNNVLIKYHSPLAGLIPVAVIKGRRSNAGAELEDYENGFKVDSKNFFICYKVPFDNGLRR